jgi:hypothetical protein
VFPVISRPGVQRGLEMSGQFPAERVDVPVQGDRGQPLVLGGVEDGGTQHAVDAVTEAGPADVGR